MRIQPQAIEMRLPRSISQIWQNQPAIDSFLTCNGWIKTVRAMKNVAFVELTDGTTSKTISCVCTPEQAAGLKTGESVTVDGTWVQSKGKGQTRELKAEKITLLGSVSESYPLQKKFQTQNFLRQIPEYKWKVDSGARVLRARSAIESSLTAWFAQQGFAKVAPPLVTASDCEGAGELFYVDSRKGKYFGKPAYMTVSTQLHLEILTMAMNNVWTLSPCFRAEESDTARHLSEFWMLEMEAGWVTDVRQLTTFIQELMRNVAKVMIEGDYLPREGAQQLLDKWHMLSTQDYPVVSYTEAIRILQESGVDFKYKPVWGEALQTEHEKWLAGEYYKKPCFVTDYPKDEKAFYMKQNADGKTVACFDFLVPGMGELVGGSLREESLEKLTSEMNRRGMNLEEMKWYLSSRENGSIPHGGFGLGMERLISYMLDIENVRDVIPFYRTVGHIDF